MILLLIATLHSYWLWKIIHYHLRLIIYQLAILINYRQLLSLRNTILFVWLIFILEYQGGIFWPTLYTSILSIFSPAIKEKSASKTATMVTAAPWNASLCESWS